MIVDDVEDVVRMTSLLMQLYGHETLTATSGAEALALAREQKCDAVLLDLGMPGMHGLEVAKELRKLWGERPAIVAVTGWSSKSVRERCLSEGFDYFLTKPADMRKACALVVHAVEKKCET